MKKAELEKAIVRINKRMQQQSELIEKQNAQLGIVETTLNALKTILTGIVSEVGAFTLTEEMALKAEGHRLNFERTDKGIEVMLLDGNSAQTQDNGKRQPK